MTECKTVKGPNNTLNEFIYLGEKRANNGQEKNFWRYIGYKDNCQKFVNDLLVSNGINHLTSFVLQDIEQLVKTPFIKNIMKSIVDAYTLFGNDKK